MDPRLQLFLMMLSALQAVTSATTTTTAAAAAATSTAAQAANTQITPSQALSTSLPTVPVTSSGIVPTRTTTSTNDDNDPNSGGRPSGVPDEVVHFLTSAFNNMLTVLKDIFKANGTEPVSKVSTSTTTEAVSTTTVSSVSPSTGISLPSSTTVNTTVTATSTAAITTTAATTATTQQTSTNGNPNGVSSTSSTVATTLVEITTAPPATAATTTLPATTTAAATNTTTESTTTSPDPTTTTMMTTAYMTTTPQAQASSTTATSPNSPVSSTASAQISTTVTGDVSQTTSNGPTSPETADVINSLRDAFNNLLGVVGGIINKDPNQEAGNSSVVPTGTPEPPGTSATSPFTSGPTSTSTMGTFEATNTNQVETIQALTSQSPLPPSTSALTSQPPPPPSTSPPATTTAAQTEAPKKEPSPIIIMVINHPYLSKNGYLNNPRYTQPGLPISRHNGHRRLPSAFVGQEGQGQGFSFSSRQPHQPFGLSLHPQWPKDSSREWLTAFGGLGLPSTHNRFPLMHKHQKSATSTTKNSHHFRRHNSIYPYSLSSGQAQKPLLTRPLGTGPFSSEEASNWGGRKFAFPFWLTRPAAATTSVSTATTTTMTTTTTTTTTKPSPATPPRGPVPVNSFQRRFALSNHRRPNPWLSRDGFWGLYSKLGRFMRDGSDSTR